MYYISIENEIDDHLKQLSDIPSVITIWVNI